MAIVNSIATFLPDCSQLIQRTAVAMTTAASPQSVVVPSSGSISPAVVRGKARCKFYNQTTAITVTVVTLTGTDGTNTVTLASWNPSAGIAIAATTYLDLNFDFLTDTSTAGGGATGTLIFGGATSLTFVVTMTGASGAASGDFEIAAEP